MEVSISNANAIVCSGNRGPLLIVVVDPARQLCYTLQLLKLEMKSGRSRQGKLKVGLRSDLSMAFISFQRCQQSLSLITTSLCLERT